MLKLGSLFDGSGGFPLAGVLHGIEPVWASEIEPYPMRVTAARFPHMKQLGDVTKINGAEIEPVDIITFGSPCQDLSVAGKQAGIHDGARSSLFFEAIRIIKEMRDATADNYPRFAVWENVPGAFSSNRGQDFRAVLQAFCDIWGGQDHIVPMPPKGRWTPAGCIVGDGRSLAWRLYDAQFWGVPQRRKRIYLIADFAGERAGEILFKPESLSGNPEPGEAERQGASCDAPGSAGGSDRVKCLNPWDPESSRYFDVTGAYCTLYTSGGGVNHSVVYCLQGNAIDRADTAGCNGRGYREDTSYTLNTIDRPAVVCLNDQGGAVMSVSDKAATLRAQEHGHQPTVCYDARGNGEGGVVPTLTGDHQNRVTDYTALAVQGTYKQDSFGEFVQDDRTNTLKARDYKAVEEIVVQKQTRKYIVRRLTPLECCRLQGFPDWWCDGVEGSDSAQYKMWGNGIALPCAADVLGRIAEEMTRDDRH